MKVVFALLLSTIAFFPCKALNNTQDDHIGIQAEKKKQEIDCTGHLPPSSPNRKGGEALKAFLIDNGVLIEYYSNVGIVDIVIEAEDGTIVRSYSSCSMGGDTTISTIGLTTGSYILKMSNTNGFLTGKFYL
ncbi:DUF3244 domain-containing protein [Sphingobacterium thalpophilum]|uniref:Por secretion system C-terminal sorting domain n=1 Tax=Sphingobacterium thalpophilum TaxID=259 RepID=A0A4U9UTU1_9SPHI|nr:DUF3244 domain-containing protein [Sphingobacterium thalpophilum]VTR36593.1 Uncharacterised protein [Sphingobacterium thalpophilum]